MSIPLDENLSELLSEKESMICPHCNTGIKPIEVIPNKIQEGIFIASIFQCPLCKRFIFTEFKAKIIKGYSSIEDYILCNDCSIEYIEKSIYPPNKFPDKNIPIEIKNIYPSFYEIYHQSFIAENENLTKIAGMGYRKALEYLVEDYLKDTFPDKKEDINKNNLSKNIAMIPYPRAVSLARAACYIGNDETHTTKKNPEYNIQDMKKFIIYLCHLILAEKFADNEASLLANKPKLKLKK